MILVFLYLLMQQYYCNEPLKVGEEYIFTKEQAHHAAVVRLHHETVRLVYEGRAFFADCFKDEDGYKATILSEDMNSHELDCEVTLLVSLIRKEKFELVLQKASELGVTRIVPLEAERCVVQMKKEKADKQLSRWNDIVKEAAQQCKRNIIPAVTAPISVKDTVKYLSEVNAIAYENADTKSLYLSDVLKDHHSISVVIGPEGGFSEKELQKFIDMGFTAVSFGSRILRAETASIYACSVISEYCERRKI